MFCLSLLDPRHQSRCKFLFFWTFIACSFIFQMGFLPRKLSGLSTVILCLYKLTHDTMCTPNKATCTPDNFLASATLSDIVRSELQLTWKNFPSVRQNLWLMKVFELQHICVVDKSFNGAKFWQTFCRENNAKLKLRAVRKAFPQLKFNEILLTLITLWTSYIAILLSTGFDWVHFFKKRLQAVDQCRPCRASSYGEWRCCCNGQLRHLPKTSSHNPKKSQCWIDISSSYIPEFNSYEFCFRFMKAYLRQQAEQFWINFKELAMFADNYASHVANHRHCHCVIVSLKNYFRNL